MEGSRAHPNYTNLIEYINLSPRFYSRDTLAYALANQFLDYLPGG